jgi:ribosomal protein S7
VKVNTKNGHKKKSLKLLLDSLASARRQLKLRLSNKEILKKIYTKVNPFFVLRKHSFGRRTSLIPLPLREEKVAGATARLFFGAVRRRGEGSLKEKLTEEIKDFFLKNKKPASIVARNARIQTALENKGNIRFLGKKNKRKRR